MTFSLTEPNPWDYYDVKGTQKIDSYFLMSCIFKFRLYTTLAWKKKILVTSVFDTVYFFFCSECTD